MNSGKKSRKQSGRNMKKQKDVTKREHVQRQWRQSFSSVFSPLCYRCSIFRACVQLSDFCLPLMILRPFCIVQAQLDNASVPTRTGATSQKHNATLCIIMLHCYILLCKFACELVQGLTWTLDRCLVFGESLRHLETSFGNEMKRGALKRTWTFRDLWCLWRLGDMMRDEILESVQLSSSTSGTSGTPELWKKPGNAKSVGSSSFHGATSALPPRESKRIQGHFQGKTKKCNIDRSK